MDQDEFINSLRSFYNHIKRTSMVPFDNDLPKKEDILRDLYNDIIQQTYQPSLPREYIISNKSNYVSRIIPTFTLKDFCVYFYCINNIQDCVCDVNDRVDGTFGGWTISNPIQHADDKEKEDLINQCEWFEYISISSLTIRQWMNNWMEFSKLSYAKSVEYEDYQDDYVVAIFDIANFYDNIKLDILENKLRLKCQTSEKNKIIDLLIYFLKYWNKPFEGYFPKSCGLPQEETGDCSRILANFYLRDYDKEFKYLCKQHNCEYLRFADDMTIFAPNRKTAEFIIFEASKLLHKIGLNINCSKVKFFNKIKYQEYQAFEILTILEEDTADSLNRAVNMYFQYKDDKKDFRKDRVIRRIITVLSKNPQYIAKQYKNELYNEIMNEDTLSTANIRYLTKVYDIMKKEGREDELLKSLESLIDIINFNSFHYTLLKFYKKIKKLDIYEDKLHNAIKIRKIY